MNLLDPKNDFVFKKLFGEAPLLLTALINAVRSQEPPLAVVEVLNPRIDPEELTGWCGALSCGIAGSRP
ncbi:MAG: hypothetical protein WAT23_07575 [Chromatiaceae bacterium]